MAVTGGSAATHAHTARYRPIPPLPPCAALQVLARPLQHRVSPREHVVDGAGHRELRPDAHSGDLLPVWECVAWDRERYRPALGERQREGLARAARPGPPQAHAAPRRP